MIERDGYPFVFSALGLSAILFGVYALSSVRWVITPAIVSAILALFFAYFFRSPERTPPHDTAAILSPADGRVLQVMSLESHPGFVGPVTKIAIFLSVFDVHINWVPAKGVIESVRYIPGQFHLAYVDKASESNERNEITMRTAQGRIVFTQIAGSLARRIVCRLHEGQSVEAGEKYGMIKFGSRVDIYFSADIPALVKVGDRVIGRETIIARALVTATGASATARSQAQTF